MSYVPLVRDPVKPSQQLNIKSDTGIHIVEVFTHEEIEVHQC